MHLEKNRESFEVWRKHHGKTYGAKELEQRFEFWIVRNVSIYPTFSFFTRILSQENFEKVEKHNARFDIGLETFMLGMEGVHADKTNEEYRKLVLGLRKRRSSSGALETFDSRSVQDIPESWSWVNHGVITKVKDQGDCGSYVRGSSFFFPSFTLSFLHNNKINRCWSFSATAAMEAAFNKKNNGSIPKECTDVCGKMNNTCCSFSNQEVADCTLGGADTCDLGGEPHDGILEIANGQHGLINTDEDYPYVSGKSGKLSKCVPKSSSAISTGIKGYANITSGDEDALTKAAYTYASISVGIDASSFAFQLYSSGIYNEKSCSSTELDHGVTVVGYGLGTPTPPGPPGPKPGPADCEDNHYKSPCTKEKGCSWCSDHTGFGWCQNIPCDDSDVAVTKNSSSSYYIVKNSWGSDWGMNGYIMMSRGKNNQCGIATDAVYVLIE